MIRDIKKIFNITSNIRIKKAQNIFIEYHTNLIGFETIHQFDYNLNSVRWEVEYIFSTWSYIYYIINNFVFMKIFIHIWYSFYKK